MRFKLLLTLIVIYYISSCSNDNRTSVYSPFIYANDTISLKLKHAESNFTIPSPYQISFLIKNFHLGFYENLALELTKLNNLNSTTFKKSMALGIVGADLGYLNLYDQKELSVKYLYELKKLTNDLEISQSMDKSIIKKMEDNFTNNDTVFRLLSQIYRNSDQYLKDNDRRDVCALIIAGGWLESFYHLTQLYSKTKRTEIFNIILFQGEVINNLIKMLSPYYEKSIEYAGLIDDLVNLAYEFDVLEYDQSVTNVKTDSISGLTLVHNRMEIKMTGSKLEHLVQYASNMRNKQTM